MSTLAELEARVSALEAGGRESEALTPNYLTIDPATGQTGADFTGHVHAQGLDLDAATLAGGPDQDRVRWIRTNDGAVVAYLAGWDDGARAHLDLEATGTESQAVAQLIAAVPAAFGNVVAQADNVTPANNRVTVGVSGFSALALDGAGDSDFVQIVGRPGNQALAIDNNTAGVTWAGSQSSGATVVNHGLGHPPKRVALTPSAFTGAIATGTTLAWGLGTNTQFTIWGWRSGISTITLQVDWIALG